MSWWPWNWGSGTIEDPAHPHASRFVVIFEDRIRLAESTDVMEESAISRQFNFDLYDVYGSRFEPVILSFNLANSNHLQLTVDLNKQHAWREFSTGQQRSVHWILGGRSTLAARNGANQLVLRVQKGSCTISDFVIWHQVTSEG
jgi:hypothetical protein